MKARPKTIWGEIRQALSEGWGELRALGGEIGTGLQPIWRTRLMLALRVAVAGFIVIALAGAVAIYGLGWQNSFTRTVARFVPYPAAVSLHGFVLFGDYADEEERIKVFTDQTGVKLSDRDRSRQALNQRLNVLAVERLAAKKKASVSAQELAGEYDRIVKAYGGEKATLEILRKQYGMSRAEYRGLIREQLLRQKAEAAWASDAAGLESARSRASGILSQATEGANFDDLAVRHSQETSKDLIDAATLPENVALAVSQVKDGELVGRPMEAGNSFYLVKRIKTEEGRVLAQVIVIRPPDFGQRLAAEMAAGRSVRLFWPAR